MMKDVYDADDEETIAFIEEGISRTPPKKKGFLKRFYDRIRRCVFRYFQIKKN